MKKIPFSLVSSACLACVALWADTPDCVLADFEDGTFQGWIAEGAGFGTGASRGAEPQRAGPYSGFMGKYWAHTFRPMADEGKPAPLAQCVPNTGKLVSPEFTIERPYLNFLIGGGKSPDIAVRLRVDGKTVREATGNMGPMEKQPRLEWQTWDVRDLQGKRARIEAQDASNRYYLMVDQFVQSERDYAHTPSVRTLAVDKDWMHLPISSAGRQTLMRLKADGVPMREFEVALAPAGVTPDFWVYEDMRAFRGKNLTVTADWTPHGDADLASLTLSDKLPQQDGIYREARRPLFHYSPMRGRIADPVGLVWHDGEYHAFFQHWSYGLNQQAARHWGHAVSKDLLHWTELPAALYTDKLGTVFSGSAVEDTNNTAGFQAGDKPPIVCVYTSAGGWSPMNYGMPAAQSIAYSNDNGRTFTKYDGNPVLPNFLGGNRDPKVLWHAPSRQWFMALYLQDSRYRFFTSKDLKTWTAQGEIRIPGIIENPDLYPIALDGDPAKEKWIFSANGVYCIGRFDGKEFTVEAGPFSARAWCNTWAEQTFDNQPQGRRLQMAYLQRAKWSGEAFNYQTTFPRELTLRTTPEGPRLFALPIDEIRQLYAQTWTLKDAALGAAKAVEGARGEAFDIEAVFRIESPQAKPFLTVKGEKIWYDAATQTLHCQTFKAPLKAQDGVVRLRVLADRASLEIFGNDGIVCISTGVDQPAPKDTVEVGVEGGKASADVTVNAVRSVWKPLGQ